MKLTTDTNNDPCSQFVDSLDAWLAMELAGEHNHAMQVHHDSCADCQLETTLARAIDVVTETLPAQVSTGLRPALRKDADNNKVQVGWVAAQHPPTPNNSFIAHMRNIWSRPLVFIPALAVVMTAFSVFHSRVVDVAIEPEIVIIDGQQYTREEIVKAAEDLQIALRYLDKYGDYPAKLVHAELEQSHLPLPPPQKNGDAPAIY